MREAAQFLRDLAYKLRRVPSELIDQRDIDALFAFSAEAEALPDGVDAVREAAIELLSHLKLYVVEELKGIEADMLHDRMYDLTRALSSAPREDELHGPHGYLVIIPGLDEEHWYSRDDPETASGYVSLPMFTKVDPFKVTPPLSDNKAKLPDAADLINSGQFGSIDEVEPEDAGSDAEGRDDAL